MLYFTVSFDHPLAFLICNCRSLIDQLPGSRLAHIYREENACADLWQSMEEMLDLPSFFCTRFPIFL